MSASSKAGNGMQLSVFSWLIFPPNFSENSSSNLLRMANATFFTEGGGGGGGSKRDVIIWIYDGIPPWQCCGGDLPSGDTPDP